MSSEADDWLKNMFREAMAGLSASDPEEYIEDGRIDVNSRHEADRTPLMMAFHYSRHNDRHEAIRLLMKSPDLDLNATCAGGKTALIYAVEAGQNDWVLRLLRKDCSSINVQDAEGETALMKAARLNNYTLAVGLVQWGATTGLTNRDGKTAADIAREAGALSLAAEVTRDKADILAEHFNKGSDRPIRTIKRLTLRMSP